MTFSGRFPAMGAQVLLVVVALTLTGCGRPRPELDRLVVATGTHGGVYEVLGDAYARRVRDAWGTDASTRETAASLENLRLVASGAADVGFTTVDAARLAVTGGGTFAGPQPVTALAGLYDDYVQVVVRANDGIAGLPDLRGKRVSTGAPESGSELVAARLLHVAGLDGAVRRSRLGVAASAAALREGRIDAFFFSGGLPTPAVASLAPATPIALLPIVPYVEPLRAAYGEEYLPRSIPVSAYGLATEVPTVAILNLLVANAAMDDDVAYALTALLFESVPDLARANDAAREINRRSAIDTFPVRLHPGARRYYRSQKLGVADPGGPSRARGPNDPAPALVR